MKKIYNIVLLVVIVTILTATGCTILDSQYEIEETKASYYKTDFDFIVTAPIKEQIDSFKANLEAVNNVLPAYHIKSNNGGVETSIMLVENMNDTKITFFNDKTLIDGEFSTTGALMDKNMAEKLNLSVGDKYSVQLGRESFSFDVAAIYMPISYDTFMDGLIILPWSEKIKNSFPKKLGYGFAFIEANDYAKCSAMLSDYIPKGNILSKEEFIENFKLNNKKPGGYTDAEWEQAILNSYNRYVEGFSKNKANAVQEKASLMKTLDERMEVKTKKNNSIMIGTIIAAFILTCISFILFGILNKNRNIIEFNDGVEHILRNDIIIDSITIVMISVISLVILLIKKAFMVQFEGALLIILLMSCVNLASLIIAIPVKAKYTQVYLGEAQRKKEEEMRYQQERFRSTHYFN